jgi:hypothetical protein
MTGGCNTRFQRSFQLIEQARRLLDRCDALDDDFEKDNAWELVVELLALVNEFREIYPAKTFGMRTDCLRRGKRNPHAAPAH